MNLWLSPHGIWYYRKVTTLPCGRRKEIKKSLHTRDKLTARAAVAKRLACVRSKAKPGSCCNPQASQRTLNLSRISSLLFRRPNRLLRCCRSRVTAI